MYFVKNVKFIYVLYIKIKKKNVLIRIYNKNVCHFDCFYLKSAFDNKKHTFKAK